ncbi:MAG: hypothetical protein WDM91_21690 [Rhizomicrobium sp.]
MRLAPSAGLLVLALLLAGAIAYEAIAPLEPVQVAPAPPLARPRAELPVPFVPPAEESFADLDARPLFASTRKPLNDPAQANGAASAASDFSLVGVIMGSERAVALLRIKSTASTMSAIVGGTVNGWRVARIDATTITLRANGSEVTVPLEGPADRPPSAPLPQASAPITQAPAAAAPTPPMTTGAPSATTPRPVAATPAAPAKPLRETVVPDALKGAIINPATGEPTL